MTLNPIRVFKKLVKWFSGDLSQRTRILLAVIAVIGLIAMGYAVYKVNDYFENDPNSCFACHVHDEANKQWAKSEHARINCHECHHSTKKDQVKQMFRFAFLGQRSVEPRHGEVIVPRTLCLHCHWEQDDKFPNAPDIGRSRYHAKHVFNEKIECTKCHGYRTHKFSMEERYCLTCHSDRDFRLPGKNGQAGAKLPMGDLPCLNCHTDRTSTLLPGKKKCLFCHGEERIRQELIADATFDVRHFPPSEETIKKAKKIHAPADAAMQFDCITCHKPHVEALPNWANCTVLCHANVPKTGKHEIHLQMGLQCSNCHMPHMWKVTPALAKKECVTCHTYKDPKLFVQ